MEPCSMLTENEEAIRLQKNFRAIMNAFARPSTVYRLEPMRYFGLDEPKIDLCQSILDVFVDHHTSYYIDFSSQGKHSAHPEILLKLSASLSGHQSARSDQADYVVFWDGTSDGKVNYLRLGSLEYPDESATAVYIVEKICFPDKAVPGPGSMSFQVTGPGIPGKGVYTITGLEKREIELIRLTNSRFPLGVDVLFVDLKGYITGLPRSSTIWIEG